MIVKFKTNSPGKHHREFKREWKNLLGSITHASFLYSAISQSVCSHTANYWFHTEFKIRYFWYMNVTDVYNTALINGAEVQSLVL